MKVEPTADLRSAAKGVYQMYVALVDEGFTEAQALQIVGVAVSAAIKRDGGEG